MAAQHRPPVHRALVLHEFADDFRPLFAERLPDIECRFAGSTDDAEPLLESYEPDVVFSIRSSTFAGDLHRRAAALPSVKWFHVGGSGYDHLLPWPKSELVVTNGVGVLSRFLAETVTGAMLALNGHLFDYRTQQRRRSWQAIPFDPLCGKTLLVVGLGAIGGHVAENARALGMKVMAIRASGTPHHAVDELYGPEMLAEIIGHADVVSIHVRLNDETRRLFGRDMLMHMKPNAILINTSRGPVVDEKALAEVMQLGHLSAAYLDVFETEPLPPESPLWDLPNVLITPHASDNVSDWPIRFAAKFCDNVERWNNGEPLENLIKDVNTAA